MFSCQKLAGLLTMVQGEGVALSCNHSNWVHHWPGMIISIIYQSCQLSCAWWLTLIWANDVSVRLRETGLLHYAFSLSRLCVWFKNWAVWPSRFSLLLDFGYLHTAMIRLTEYNHSPSIVMVKSYRGWFLCVPCRVGWISCLPRLWTDYWSD